MGSARHARPDELPGRRPGPTGVRHCVGRGIRRGRFPRGAPRPHDRGVDRAAAPGTVACPRHVRDRDAATRTVPVRPRATELPGVGWTIVYNVNDPVAVATDPHAYGGRFVQPAAPRSGGDELVERGVSALAHRHVAPAVTREPDRLTLGFRRATSRSERRRGARAGRLRERLRQRCPAGRGNRNARDRCAARRRRRRG